MGDEVATRIAEPRPSHRRGSLSGDVASITQKKGVRFVLFISPVYETYKERITDTMYNDMLQFVKKLQDKYSNVEFYNFLYADGYLPEDFNDSSHLTDTGAIKFSKLLAKVIHPQK